MARSDSTQYLNLEYLDQDDMHTIEVKAKALTLQECFDFMCVDIDDVPLHDLNMAKRAHSRGRAVAIVSAADKLFSSMSMRGGGAVALDYLRTLSGTFQVEATPNSSAKNGFVFNVIMPEEETTT